MDDQATIKADDVCAFLWARACYAERLNACAIASIPIGVAQMHWHELSPAERTQIAVALADEIATIVSKQPGKPHEEKT